MNTLHGVNRVTEPLMRADCYPQQPGPAWGQRLATPPTIALSRQAGSRGQEVAQAVARRLGWACYDHQLIEKIAEQMKVRPNLLETIDERRRSWLEETVDWLALGTRISDRTYFRCLMETLLALAAKGECVIVGRGGAFALPAKTTLRLRLVAPLPDRIVQIGREHGLSAEAAARRVEASDRQQAEFVREHFGRDPADPAHYDLVLNTSSWSIESCADQVLAGLHCLQQCTPSARGLAEPPVAWSSS